VNTDRPAKPTVKSYLVKADADWKVETVRSEGDVLRDGPTHRKYPMLYRCDVPQDHHLWDKEYQNTPKRVLGVPVDVYIDAPDELGAFVKAQAWLDKHKPKPEED